MPLLDSPMPGAVHWTFPDLTPVGIGDGDHRDFAVLMITGSREFTDLRLVSDTLKQYHDAFKSKYPNKFLLLVSGHAQQGADVLAEMVWSEWDAVAIEPADWNNHVEGRCKCLERDPKSEYCKLAGIVRNEKMVDFYKPSVVVAFYADGAANRGTNHASEYARQKGVPVRIVREPLPKVVVDNESSTANDNQATVEDIKDALRPDFTTFPPANTKDGSIPPW